MILSLIITTSHRELSRDDWINVSATVITAIAAIVALWFSLKSLKRIEQGLYADVLLRLDQEMQKYREIHANFRPGGRWTDDHRGPETSDDWINVDAYMGLFERINFFIDQDLISIDFVE